MTVERIVAGKREIILVGTAHISQASVDQVKETIGQEKPDSVGIELDSNRFEQLKNPGRWQNTNIQQVIQQGRAYLLLLNIFLSNMQRRFGEHVQVTPGQEMMIAAQTAAEQNIPVALLDRDVNITMKRALSLMPLLEKIKIFFYLITGTFSESEKLTVEKIEELKQSDMVTKLIQELGHKAPTIKKVLVDERDAFIANQILKNSGQKMVCVVGAGHLDGIKELLQHPQPIDEQKLLEPPKKGMAGELLKWVIPAAFVVILGWAFFSKGLSSSLTVIVYWILITGFFSALGALISRAHLFSVATAFVAAPLTTLHPLLASGWFAAAVEAKYKHPQVKDFENLNQLNSYADFEKNKVTHLLLVAAYTNLGSMVGVLVALPWLLKLVA